MSNLFARSFSPARALSGYKKSTTGILLSLSFAAVGLPQLPAHSADVAAQPASPQTVAANLVSQSRDGRLPDGVYLYGQAQQPAQVGSAYMVFEVNADKVVGAFYMPHSSFDCFYGNLEPSEMALTVIDSYEQEAHPYSVALEQTSDVADAGNPSLAPVQIEGFNRISSVSENDQRMLQTCQADYQERVQ